MPVAGRTLIDRQLEALAGVGVRQVVVVTGYEAGQVRRHLGSRARCVVNEAWRTTNSIESLHRALGYLEGDAFLFNCDILFDRAVLERLGEVPGSAIAVDSRAAREEGEMNLRIDGSGRVGEIGKHLDPAAAHAVSVQLVRFDADGSAMIRSEVRRLVEAGEGAVYPTAAYGPLIRSGSLRAVETGDLPWFEIDSLEDHERASRELGRERPGDASR